jgi:hypothetical protein
VREAVLNTTASVVLGRGAVTAGLLVAAAL